MNNSKKYLFLTVTILLVVIGVSLAYFGITIIGNDTAKGNKVVTGNLELTYTDTTEISLENAFPGDSFEKTISVKNTGTKEVNYNLVWTELNNEITNNELVIEAICKRLNSSGTEDGTCESISQTPVSSNTIKKNISIEPNITHEYTVKVIFIDTGKLQDYNKNKSFTGKLGINEYKDNSPTPTYCTYDGELTQGAEYINGQYTYRYMQENSLNLNTGGTIWQNIDDDGWGVVLTDKTSTDPVTSTLCTYINNKPVVSTAWLFFLSVTPSIDLSSFNTKNITNMHAMFANTELLTSLNVSNFDTSNVTDMGMMFGYNEADELDLSSFDTSNVTDMRYMFNYSQAEKLDLSNFNTSKVIDMSSMFENSQAITINLSSFNTSNVTNMNSMFRYSKASTLDLSNFNTSKVTTMNGMFKGIQVKTLDLSNFDTSNVTDMMEMFCNSKLDTLNINSFNTSNVTDMSYMFWGTQISELALNNFDTSKVTNMKEMFYDCKATVLDLSSFNTSNVTDMKQMFYNSQAVILDLSSFDTSKITDMEEMFENSQAVTIDLSSFDTSNVTIMYSMFHNATNLKTIYASEKFDTSNAKDDGLMFTGCTNLVGGAGTTYDSTKTDKTYARIDGGTSSPGYFTLKTN